jgi:hypothetical protein
MRADLDGFIDREIGRLLAAARTPAASHPPRPPAEATAPMIAAPAAPRVPPAGPGPGPEDDVGSRLDALARRLEGRLNRPRGRSAGAYPKDQGESDRDSTRPGPTSR